MQEGAAESGLAETSIRTSVAKGSLRSTVKFERKLIARADLNAYRQRTQPDGVKKVGRPRKGQEVATE